MPHKQTTEHHDRRTIMSAVTEVLTPQEQRIALSVSGEEADRVSEDRSRVLDKAKRLRNVPPRFAIDRELLLPRDTPIGKPSPSE